MKSIAFFNNKGGVGKTTLLCNLAGYLSIKLEEKVLVIDADPQCNTTSYVLPEDSFYSFYFTYENTSGHHTELRDELKILAKVVEERRESLSATSTW